ncbi:protein DWD HYPERSENSITIVE TO UV-B 1 isoform X2 [Gastrolobium bilobum]|uniref:protein DWD HYPERSENSITIVE TO UV-B 1 isoform X2 n=1 Tax=Gastrolobium bilobum TaxID=150636 RepID=UPI002AB27F28|nr:protein DWD HYPERSENSITIVE TO UV-B 1 isoform X2 [Gastrolobium bilobum]
MAVDIQTLEDRYIDSCRRHGVLPNTAILSSFFKAEVKKSCQELCSLEIILDDLKDIDFAPLLDVCMNLDTSEIEAVDVRSESSCVLNGEYALSLMRAINQKLQVVDLQDLSFGKDFLRDISRRGLACQVLTLKSSRFQKLNLIGEFMHMHTLNLDFSSTLMSFQEDCFNCMPNLMCLSMCDTRITNLWTTVAALSKLPSLVELRFQYWQYCNDADPETYNISPCGKSDGNADFSLLNSVPFIGESSTDTRELTDPNFSVEDPLRNFYSFDEEVSNHDVQSMVEDSSDDSEVDFTSLNHRYWLSDVFPGWNFQVPLQNENEEMKESLQGTFTGHIADISMKYMSRHASPICYEKHYREFMIASLPNLKILDNVHIRKIDKERATGIFSQYFEYLPYRWKHKESVVNILQKREIKSGHIKARSSKCRPSYPSGKSQYLYTRSLSAAKMGSSTWPFLHPLSILGCELDKGFRPRQFEYHPSDSSLMVFGTLDGEVVVINHENEHIVSYIPSLGAMNSVLGLCWLKKYPSKLIAGSDNGSLKLYDIRHTPKKITGIYGNSSCVTFDEFDQLTSVHVNSTDELFLASGYSRNVALYDINSGKRLEVFTDMHHGHINVVKFANHSPSIFATSSFDQDVKMWDLRQKPIHPCFTASSSRGNVMVCFSPDDQYILASAVDNEVKQLQAVDGRLHLVFDIASTGSSQNYTRSYYLNGRDYIISGSCDEHVVRVCCAQTGRRLRDISLEGRSLGSSMFVQSLRGDPFRDFNLSVLAAYMRPGSKSEIVKVNLLASGGHAKDDSDDQRLCPSPSMGA